MLLNNRSLGGQGHSQKQCGKELLRLIYLAAQDSFSWWWYVRTCVCVCLNLQMKWNSISGFSLRLEVDLAAKIFLCCCSLLRQLRRVVYQKVKGIYIVSKSTTVIYRWDFLLYQKTQQYSKYIIQNASKLQYLLCFFIFVTNHVS